MPHEYEKPFYLQSELVKQEQEHEPENEALMQEAQRIFEQFSRATIARFHKSESAEYNERKRKMHFSESLDIQRRKQTLMEELHKKFRAIDQGIYEGEKDSDGKEVVGDSDGNLFIIDQEGQRMPIRLGDIIADREWGIHYNIDSKSVPRNIQKRLLLEAAKSVLSRLFDRQLVLLGGISGAAERHERLDQDLRENGPISRRTMGGYVAERMVYTFFLRNEFAASRDFTASRGNTYLDAIQKIDFLLHRHAPRYRRGVDTVAVEESKTMGFQLKNLKRDRQIVVGNPKSIKDIKGWNQHVNDVVSLHVPAQWTHGAFSQWIEAGKPSGGPEQFLSPKQQKQLFRAALQKMFTQEEIEQQWVASAQPSAAQSKAKTA